MAHAYTLHLIFSQYRANLKVVKLKLHFRHFQMHSIAQKLINVENNMDIVAAMF